MEVKVVKKDDGYWLSLKGKTGALIHLGEINNSIAIAALEEAAAEETSSKWHTLENGGMWRYVDPEIQAQMPEKRKKKSLRERILKWK